MAGNVAIYLTVALSFATSAVAIAGLASLQNGCEENTAGAGIAYLNTVTNFSSRVLTCGSIYRYWWFVIAYEVVLFLAVPIVTFLGGMRRQRTSWMGMYAVGALLFITMTEAFLTAQDIQWYLNIKSTMSHKSRTTTAGALMTAIVNTWMVVLLGVAEDAIVPKPDEDNKATI